MTTHRPSVGNTAQHDVSLEHINKRGPEATDSRTSNHHNRQKDL